MLLYTRVFSLSLSSTSSALSRALARQPPLVSWSSFQSVWDVCGSFLSIAHLASVATGSFLIGWTGSLAFAPPAPPACCCCCCACIAACAVGKLCNN